MFFFGKTKEVIKPEHQPTKEELRKVRKTERENKLYQKYNKKPSVQNILQNGSNPFIISKDKDGDYQIDVYNFNTSKWEEITSVSNVILGIDPEEFKRMMVEFYQADYYSDICQIYFRKGKMNRAIKMIKMFRPYYDNFHIPRAMADRLAFYTEGGFPPPDLMVEKAAKNNLEKSKSQFKLIS